MKVWAETIKDSEGSWARGRLGRCSPSTNTIPTHGTCEGFTTGEQVLAEAFSFSEDGKIARCLRARRVAQ